METLRTLPLHHRDPFDRMIIAQAIVRGLPLISADEVFREYDAPVVW
jgi:PIN domain nuclease of toxin-antitoxin system